MRTVQQRRILEAMGLTYWVDRTAVASMAASSAAPPSAGPASSSPANAEAGGRSGMPEALRELLEDGAPAMRQPPPAARSNPRMPASPTRPENSGAAERDRPGTVLSETVPAPRRDQTPPALGCFWLPGTLLLSDGSQSPEDRRFCQDLLLAVAALSKVDRSAPSHRASFGRAKAGSMVVTAAELATGATPFGDAALGFLRKRLAIAEARQLVVVGGAQGSAVRWLLSAEPTLALSDRLDPALAALGARSAQWHDPPITADLLVVPPIALLRAEPARKAQLWRWLRGTLTP